MSKKMIPCIICGREFEPTVPNAKYCSPECAITGRDTRRREWEQRSGYLLKQRIKSQKRRERLRIEDQERRKIKAENEAQTREKLASEIWEKHLEKYNQAAESGDGLSCLILAAISGNNKSPEYWDAYKAYDLEQAELAGKKSQTVVNGISVSEDNFSVLVCESIAIQGRITTNVDHIKVNT